MNSIDQKVVEMRFDNSQFETAVSQTMTTLEKFKDKLNFKDAGKGLSKLGKAAGDYQYTLNDVGESISNIESAFMKMGSVGSKILDTLTSRAASFVIKGMDTVIQEVWGGGMSRAMNLEQAKFQLQGILGSAEKVNRVIYSDILPELQGTPFSLDQAAVVMGQLAASGKTTSEEIHQATRAISGAAAMTNTSFAEIGRIFTKVAGNSRVMGDTLQEFSSRGLNAAADMAKYFNMVNDSSSKAAKSVSKSVKDQIVALTEGKKVNEKMIRDMISDKDTIVGYDVFAATFDFLYGEQAQKSTTMYTGALEDLKAALARVGAEPAAVKLEFLRDAFNSLVPAVDVVNGILKKYTSATKQVVKYTHKLKDGTKITSKQAEKYKKQGIEVKKLEKATKEYGKVFSGSLAKKVQKAGWSFMEMFVKLDANHDIMRYSKKNLKDLGVEVVKYTHKLKDGTKLTKAQAKEYKNEGVEVIKLKNNIKEWHTSWGQVVEKGEAVMNPHMWQILTSSTNAFVNVMTAVGKTLSTVKKGFSEAFLSNVSLENFANLAKSLEDFTLDPRFLQIFTSSANILVKTLQLASKVLGAIRRGFMAAFPKITLDTIVEIIQAIEQFTSNLDISDKTLDRIKWTARGLFTPLALTVRACITVIKAFAKILSTAYGELRPFATLATSFMGMIGKIASGLGNLFRNIAKSPSLKEKFGFAGGFLDKFLHLKDLWAKLKGLAEIWTGKFDLFGYKAYKYLSNLGKASGDVNPIVDAFSKLNSILTKIATPFKIVAGLIQKLAESLGLFKGLKDFLGELFGIFQKKIEEDDKGIFGKLGKFGDYLTIVEGLTGGLDGLLEVIGKFTSSSPLKGLKRFFSDLGDIILQMAAGFVEGDFFVDLAKDTIGWFGSFKKLGGKIKKQLVPTLDAFFMLVPKLFNLESYGDLLNAAAKKFGEGFSKFLYALGLAIKPGADKALLGVERIGKTVENLKKISEDLSGNPQFEHLRQIFQGISNIINDYFKDLDPKKARQLILGLTYFVTVLYYLTTIRSSARAFAGLTKAFEAITKGIAAFGQIGNAITGIFFAVKDLVRAVSMIPYMIALATALLSMAASMYIISRIDSDKLMGAALVMGAFLAATATIFVALGKLATKLGPKTAESIMQLSIVLAAIGFTMISLASSIYLMAYTIEHYNVVDAVGVISLLLAEFGLLIWLISRTQSLNDNITKAAWTLTAIGAGITTMVKAIQMLSSIPDEKAMNRALRVIAGLIVSFSLFAFAAGKGGANFWSGFSAIGLALALKSLARVVKMLAKLKGSELHRAEKGVALIEDLLMGMTIMIAVMMGMSTLLGKFGSKAAGLTGLGSIVAMIAVVFTIGEAVAKLAVFTEAELSRATDAIVGIMLVMAAIAGVASIGGKSFAMNAAGLGALAAGLFLLAEGMVALASCEDAGRGLVAMVLTIISLVVAISAILAITKKMIDIKAAGAIALVAGSLLLFSAAIAILAGCDINGLTMACIALLATLGVAGIVLAALSALGPGMIPLAAAFALLGIAALGVGASIFLLTAALTALIPLILGLGAAVDMSTLQDGLNVLAVAADGLVGIFKTLSDGLLVLGGAFFVLGAALIVTGLGAAAVGVGFAAAAVGVFLLAGSIMLLYETLRAFFPNVVTPVENGMSSLMNLWASELQTQADIAANGYSAAAERIQQEVDKSNKEVEDSNAEHNEITLEQQDTFLSKLLESGGLSSEEYSNLMGNIPLDSADAWESNAPDFLKSMGVTGGDMQSLLQGYADGNVDIGASFPIKLGEGIESNSGAPITALEALFPKLAEVHTKFEQAEERRGKAIDQKLSAGIDNNKNLVGDAAEGVVSHAGAKADSQDAIRQFRQAGEHASLGYAEGLKSKIRTAGDEAVRLAEESARRAKEALDEESPSRVFRKIGSFAGEGFALGMKSMIPAVGQISQELAAGSASIVADAMTACAAAFDADLDFTPTITPVVDLSEVRQSAEGINGILGGTFGINSPFSGRLNAARAAASFDAARNQNEGVSDSIDNLAKKLDGMTETMNSRSLNVYNTIDGAGDPEAFADGLLRSFRLNARTV